MFMVLNNYFFRYKLLRKPSVVVLNNSFTVTKIYSKGLFGYWTKLQSPYVHKGYPSLSIHTP